MPACQNLPQRQLRSGGVTLIELVVTMVIVAILAAVAYPSYQKYLKKGRRVAAQAHLMDLAQRQQEYLLNVRAYAVSTAALNATTPADVASFYTIAIAVDPTPPQSFTISATPLPSAAQAGDVALTLDSSNVRSPAGVW